MKFATEITHLPEKPAHLQWRWTMKSETGKFLAGHCASQEEAEAMAKEAGMQHTPFTQSEEPPVETPAPTRAPRKRKTS